MKRWLIALGLLYSQYGIAADICNSGHQENYAIHVMKNSEFYVKLSSRLHINDGGVVLTAYSFQQPRLSVRYVGQCVNNWLDLSLVAIDGEQDIAKVRQLSGEWREGRWLLSGKSGAHDHYQWEFL